MPAPTQALAGIQFNSQVTYYMDLEDKTDKLSFNEDILYLQKGFQEKGNGVEEDPVRIQENTNQLFPLLLTETTSGRQKQVNSAYLT